MPRQKRLDVAGEVYHALNRGNARQEIFRKNEDFEAFEKVLGEGLQRYPVRLFAFTLMPNHWHLVLSPNEDGMMGRMLRWVTATHTQRYHAHYQTAGEGHLYQARFKSFPVQSDEHFLSVCRYVERNPVRAKLVKRAEQWRYGSLYRWSARMDTDPSLLAPWPIRRPPRWIDRVNAPLTTGELEAIRASVQRGRPYGDSTWTEQMADRHGLWFTLRPRGRPSKKREAN